MEFRTKKNIFFQNEFVFSAFAHGVGMFLLAYWTTNSKPYVPEFEPIQIKTIIYESSLKPKLEKAHFNQPVEEVFTKIGESQPAPTRPRKRIKQIQPTTISMAKAMEHNVSLRNNNPRSVKPFTIPTAKPASFQITMPGNKVHHPYDSTQFVQVAKLISVPTNSFPSAVQTGQLVNNLRQLSFSAQPIRILEKIAPSRYSLQGAMVSNVSKRFRTDSAPNSNIGARTISEESNLVTNPGKLTQEVSIRIRTAPVNQIKPVQLASLPGEFVEASRDGELEKGLEPSTISGEPGGAIDSSGEDLRSVRKGFSSSIWGKIAKAKYYPRIAQNRRWEGKPVIEFLVGKNGDLLEYSISVASPYEILNQAALDAVKNAIPYPKIPESLKLDSIRFKLPISFKLDY
jgi:TonB family protein